MAFTQQMMEDWVRGQGYLKESDMADYLREQLFVTRDQLRREGYASGDDVRQTVIQLVADEQLAFTSLRDDISDCSKRFRRFSNTTRLHRTPSEVWRGRSRYR